MGISDISEEKTSYTGRVVDFTRELSDKNFIKVKFDDEKIDESQLIGNYIYAENDGYKNACYRINGAERSGDMYILDIGDVTTIRWYKDYKDMSSGYIYDLVENGKFTVPLRTLSGDPQVILS